MEIAYIINAIVLSFAISLGVGSSTIAIAQFFASISDGGIEPAERRLLGVVYVILRVAMAAILLTLLIQGGIIYYMTGSLLTISPFFLAVYTAVAVLFLNAIGMTFRYVPSSIGPAVQAGSWYTLGLLFALVPLGLTGFTYLQFVLVYAGVAVLAVAVVNVLMNRLKRK